jgi:putative methanogenesis marker protein 8
MAPSDNGEHIVEAIGKTRVVVKNGAVVDVGESALKSCPLARKFSKPVDEITKEAVKANIEDRIEKIGMFTDRRSVLSTDDFVIFGASELLSLGMRNGFIDSAVIVCDGAGTIIATTPEVIQGVGGRMSGLVKTSPIRGVIEKLEANGAIVLYPSRAVIDQVRGVARATELGFQRIAVTVSCPKEAERIRRDYPNTLIFGVHTTGVCKEDAKQFVDNADLITGCASKWIRQVAGKAALIQAGTSVPVFAVTKRGKELLLERVKETQQPLLIKMEKLPYSTDKSPEPLV